MRRESNRKPNQGGALQRKPKELTEQPTVFEPSSGGGGVVIGGRGGEGADRGGPKRASTVMTDEESEVAGKTPDGRTADRSVYATAMQIAQRLSIQRPRRVGVLHRGEGELSTVRYRDGVDEIDLDRTLEVLAETRTPSVEDIYVRERIRARRSVVLVVDISGSMRGERVRTAAAAMGALTAELRDEHLAVLAFWSDAAWLAHRGDPIHAARLIDALLALPVRGLTNVGFPLELSARELQSVASRDARVVMLSDCVHNAGPDPRPLAARLPRLDILLDVNGEHDLQLGRELARLGRGRVYPIRSHRDVAPALSDAFAR